MFRCGLQDFVQLLRGALAAAAVLRGPDLDGFGIGKWRVGKRLPIQVVKRGDKTDVELRHVSVIRASTSGGRERVVLEGNRRSDGKGPRQGNLRRGGRTITDRELREASLPHVLKRAQDAVSHLAGPLGVGAGRVFQFRGANRLVEEHGYGGGDARLRLLRRSIGQLREFEIAAGGREAEDGP